MSDRLISRILNKELGLSRPQLTLWPALTGVPAAGAQIVSLAGVGWGAIANIIAAGVGAGIEFWLTQMQFDAFTGVTQIMDIRINNTTQGVNGIYFAKLNITTVGFPDLAPVTFAFPIYCNPADRITGAASGAAVRQVGVSLLVATGI